MSLYSSDKCSDVELKCFKIKVLKYLTDNGIDVKKLKMRFQKNYGGNCKIQTYGQEFENSRKSIRKDEGSPTGYSKAKYSQVMYMGIYFYASEWDWYLAEEQKDQRQWDLKDIKKYYSPVEGQI
jgi:hypothetical protein